MTVGFRGLTALTKFLSSTVVVLVKQLIASTLVY